MSHTMILDLQCIIRKPGWFWTYLIQHHCVLCSTQLLACHQWLIHKIIHQTCSNLNSMLHIPMELSWHRNLSNRIHHIWTHICNSWSSQNTCQTIIWSSVFYTWSVTGFSALSSSVNWKWMTTKITWILNKYLINMWICYYHILSILL